MPPVAKPTTEQSKPKRKKKSKVKKKPRTLKLKGWLKTPEDWAKFDAWVKVNAQPRKLPEPEPIIRKAVPLRRLKKRLKVIAKPPPRPVTQCVERTITRNIRCAKTTQRTKELAFPNIRLGPDQCVELGVKKSALTYKPTKNIIRLSQPKVKPISEECRSPYAVSRGALKRKTTEKDDELARPAKRRKLDDDCVETEKKCEKEGELSPWMEFLAIPGYRVLMGQETERAQKWREQIIEELEPRGKQAYEEQMRKREEQKRRDEQRQREEQKRCEEEMKKREEEEKRALEGAKGGSQKERLQCIAEGGSENQENSEQQEEKESEESPEDTEAVEEGKLDEEDKKSKSVKISEAQEEEHEETEEEKAAREKRKMEKNAWRFEAIGTCKEFPPKIPESALNYEASPAIEYLAQPKKYPDSTCKDPYKVSEKAKSAQASPAIEALAKPKYPVEPVKRPPPREKDQFGMPIFPKPVYGKVLPEVEPYPKPECKDEEEKEEEQGQKEQPKEKKPIDEKIAFGPTIDPMYDPRGAKKQAKERERAAQAKAEQEAAEREAAEKGKAEQEAADGDATEAEADEET